eukprot:TRINITY_DN3286_c0_g1_i1.p1 TRINITY_DN3286_c0_g1~~TRINITY_DN3286_c0_g1_i1.p1  ORF type:complete len:692 (-),score=181.57 TRINITY_DN3286_c0_g1_i1:51-2126(-)
MLSNLKILPVLSCALKRNHRTPLVATQCRRFIAHSHHAPATDPAFQWKSPQLAKKGKFYEEFDRSIRDPAAFWGEQAKNTQWYKQPEQILDSSNKPFYSWFKGGKLNVCYNALDYHVDVAGRGDQTALIYESPVTNTSSKMTYKELRSQVAKFAGVLVDKGVTKGDRVVIYMPMIPEAVVAMLACARIGAAHSVVFGGFASDQLANRINHAQPKVVVSASCGIEGKKTIHYKPLLDEAVKRSEYKPSACIIVQRPMVKADLVEGRDFDYNECMAKAKEAPCAQMNANDPLYILYTSGTTGNPKGVLRDQTYAVGLKYTMEKMMNSKPGDVYWACSDIGWVVGHSFIVYGPLMQGCSTILFEGKPVGTPDAGTFWRLIEKHKVKTLYTAPTALRAIKRDDPNGDWVKKFNISSLQSLFLAGERCDPDTANWAAGLLKNAAVVDNYWQTETGWPIASQCLGLSNSQDVHILPGSCSFPVPGWDIHVLGHDHKEVPHGDTGEVAIKLPMPPGSFPTLYKNDKGYLETYMKTFPGYYRTGDAGFYDTNGYLFIMSRVDDVINTAGHRLSTGQMEEILSAHPDVAECAVIGVHDELKGEVPVGFVVLKSGTKQSPSDIEAQCVKRIRDEIGAVAAFKLCITVNALPKTRSGKILRATMRSIANATPYKYPPTIEDVSVLDKIKEKLLAHGLAKSKD